MSELRRRPHRPWIYGHRGASARAPENTQRAFALAFDEGADGIELDVRLSRDGAVVVCHDPTLERLAKRPGVVAQLDARELTHIDVGGDTIPLLDDVLDAATARAVARLLRARSARDRAAIFVSSFRPEMLAAMRVAGAGVPMAFLFDLENTGPARAAVLRRVFLPDGLHPQDRACTPQAIARWRARGLFVNAWTIDDPDRIRSLSAAGVDGIITNDPRGALSASSPQAEAR